MLLRIESLIKTLQLTLSEIITHVILVTIDIINIQPHSTFITMMKRYIDFHDKRNIIF